MTEEQQVTALKHSQTEAAAYHEAAHAVAAQSFGYKVTDLYLEDNGLFGYCGYCIPAADGRSLEGAWREAVICFSGRLAEDILVDRNLDETKAELVNDTVDDVLNGYPEDRDGDVGNAASALEHHMRDEHELRELAADAADAAAQLLRDHWDEVACLAQQILHDWQTHTIQGPSRSAPADSAGRRQK